MKALLTTLFDHQPLSRAEAREALLGISREAYPSAQIAAFITVFQMRPITLPELQGFRDALLELAQPVDLGGRDTLDIVGTGGDGKNTFNISTLAAVTVAGAGYAVAKHGSYGVSSSVGSSDVLMALGYRFTNDSDALRRQLDAANLCFLHAPLFHPALKAVAPIRRELGVKTFFNMLGPLANPLQPRYQVFGTYSLALWRLYHYVMQESRERRYAIVYALDGYDELSLTGPAKVRTNEAERLLHPHDLGAAPLRPAALYGGHTPEEAKHIFEAVLNNTAPLPQREAVAANAGLAIHTIHPERSLPDCVAEARESIAGGRARQVFQKLLSVSA